MTIHDTQPGWEVSTESPTPSTVPHSRESEEASIGAVLINPDSFFDLSAFLKADDFYIHRNKWIWEAFLRLHEKRTPIDLLTLSEELDHTGQLEEVGNGYITSLINQVPSSLNAESYGRIIEGHSIRRKMIFAANKIAAYAYNESSDVETAYAEGRKAYDNAYSQSGSFKTMAQLVSLEYDRMDKRAKGEDKNIVPTGFIDIDRMLDGGMRGGNYILVAGRPGKGKTALMLDVAKHVALTLGKRVGIFSLEMSNEQVTQRMVVKEGIPMKSIRTGKLEDHEWPLYTHAIERLSDARIYMDDMPSVNPTQLRAKTHQLENLYGIDLLIVDYIQLMGNDGKTDNRNQEVSILSRSMKVLARELNIPILCGAQLSRKVEERSEKRPILSDLRDSGSLEQDADVVIFLHREEEKEGITEAIIAKQRDGATGTVELIFRGALMKFENAAVHFKPEPPRDYTDI